MHQGFALFCLITLLTISPAWSQKNSSYLPDTSISAEDDLSFFEASPYRNKARIRGLSIGIPTAYGATMSALSIAWYDQNERNRFHFFDDAKEWQQVDKLGHSHTAYFETYWMMQSLRWAGVGKKKADGSEQLLDLPSNHPSNSLMALVRNGEPQDGMC